LGSSSPVGANIDLSGSVHPIEQATEADLSEARAAVASGRAVLRSQLVSGPFHTGANPATRGFAIDKTLGPFRDASGQVFWADVTSPFQPQVAVFEAGGHPQPWLTAPLSAVAGSPNQLAVGPGSLWIAANAFDSSAPQGFVGLLISGGTLTGSGSLSIVANQVIVAAGQSLTLQVTLNPPVNPVTSTGPGVDLGQALIALPATFGATFVAGALQNLAIATFSLTVYGSKIGFVFSNQAPKFRSDLGAIEVFAKFDAANFEIKSVKSDLWWPSGSAAIQSGGWLLSVAETTYDKLGAATGDGAISIEMKSGVSASWPALQPAVRSSSAELVCGPGLLHFFLTPAQAVVQTFVLWDAQPKPCSAIITTPKGGTFAYFSQTGNEALVADGALVPHLDRPLRVDGTRFNLQFPKGQVSVGEGPAGRSIFLTGQPALTIDFTFPIALALENALLHVNPPSGLSLIGKLNPANRVISGSLGLYFAGRRLIPTLPDPYAVAALPTYLTRFNAPPQPCDPAQPTYLGTVLPAAQVVVALTAWTTPGQASLSFELLGKEADLVHECLLLDVSSNADQLGAAAFTQTTSQIGFSEVQWTALGSRVGVATLPEISWEPMINDASSPPPPPTFAPNDGSAAFLFSPSQTLVPVEPIVLLDGIAAAVKGGALYFAQFTLPFGITATATSATAQRDPNSLALVRPKFPNSFEGGYQVSLLPSLVVDGPSRSTIFPGTASVDLGTQSAPGYGASVLNFLVAQIFNAKFQSGPEAPLERYDLSGYGASVFSDWRNPAAHGSDIIQARFDVFTGRTAYEVVQAQAFCAPFGARFVRTITIERASNARVVRYDTGWRAASDGLFQWPAIPASLFQLGALQGIVNIHNIREAGSEFSAGATTWQPVLFDADVALNPKLPILQGGAPLGANKAPVVPTAGIPGYLMILPIQTDLDPAQLWALLDKTGPVSWPVAAAVQISQSQLTMKVSSADVSHVRSAADTVVAALRGTPNLPSQGSWSLAKRAAFGTAAPVALDPLTPVPLIQNSADTSKWDFADPVDILNLTAQTQEYGFLQSTGTQKLFFAQPRVHDGNSGITPQVPPHLADVGALLGSVGAFPGLSAALQFEGAIPDFSVGDSTLAYHKEWDVTVADPVPLISFGTTVGVVLDYHFDNRFSDNPGVPVGNHLPTHVTVDINPTGWSLTMQKLSFLLVTPLGDATDPVLKVVGTLKAGSGQPPTLTDLDVVYGGVLGPVQSVFANLQQVARFLPGGIAANLDVSFSDGKLSIRDSFGLPQLPLGIGFIEGVALDLGATISLLPPKLSLSCGISSPDNPFHWLVSPLSGTGCVVVGFEDALPAITVQAGLGVGLDIDVGIAQGGASIVLGFQVNITGGSIQFEALLTGQASVDVLDGLASATITLTAGLGLTPEPFPPRLPPIGLSGLDSYKPFDDIIFMATCSVGIHISVCWLVHVDFDGSWQFTKKIDVPSIGQILPI
jgi:hypothetical protein